MNKKTERDALAIDYSKLLKEMNGISPKLALHVTLKAKAEGMHKRLVALAPEKKKAIMRPVNRTQATLKPLPRRGCAYPGCKKLGMLHGKGRYRPWCREHKAASKRAAKSLAVV